MAMKLPGENLNPSVQHEILYHTAGHSREAAVAPEITGGNAWPPLRIRGTVAVWNLGSGIKITGSSLRTNMSDSTKVNPYRGSSDAKPFDEKLTKDEIEAFYDALRDRDRAIVLSAIAENHLKSLLQLLMRRDEKEISQQLFNPSGPLGPFGTKIRLAYMLRILPPEIHKDLMIVSKIRNKFAHDLSVKSFDDQQIADWVKGMHHYNLFLNSVEAIQKKHQLERESGTPESEHKFRTIAYVLGNSAETIAGSYRETVRLIIHWIVDHEQHIKSEEERINLKPRNCRKIAIAVATVN
jgi:DNA-binding MltR family transcriptional regulator